VYCRGWGAGVADLHQQLFMHSSGMNIAVLICPDFPVPYTYLQLMSLCSWQVCLLPQVWFDQPA
jgi:hypothetical protein